MRLLLAAALLALAAGSAAAQTGTPAPAGAATAGVAAPDASPAPAGRRQPRRVEGAQAAVKPAPAKADAADTLRKAQAATAARDKAWDARMKRTLGSICHGC
ncbi:hypothetical protein FF100_05245 [Methylobacterium terricola]|uniref:Uncharacterized protein n=1 Tax=Methylobacterium terricola TaxID=2583531 RepID=A0A5C4LKE6_9HYPH|nr:hypothetical protein [Methylobacterium terricola]TNC14977.1 hypothetical protein FF100_05245 [Methylobacterium terricola]